MISDGPSVLKLANFTNGNPFKPDDLGNAGLPVIRIRQLLDPLAPIEHAIPPARPVFIHENDLIFSWSATLAVRHWNGERALLNQHLFRVDPLPGIDRKWLGYVLTVGIGLLKPLMHGSAMTHLTLDLLKMLSVSVPNTTQQQLIAEHLDIETTRIDALIATKRRLFDLLESRLIALAEDAVKGSDCDKATGMPTLPAIPSSWRILRNKVFTREINCRSVDENSEMLSVSHITGVTPRSEKTVYMFEAESTVGYKLVRPGDLVINTMWAWMGAAGVSDVHGIVSPAYGVYEFDDNIMLPEFFDILVRTPAYIAEMTRFSRGVTSSRLRLYPDEFLRLSSPVPLMKTQRAIVDRYAHHQSTVSQARERISDQIQLLQERRQALITAVVTGEMPLQRVAV